MSGRVTVIIRVMEDGRARDAECGEHGMEVLLVFFHTAATFNQKWHDQFPRPVTKGLCAPVICLLKSLEWVFFCRTAILPQLVIFIVTMNMTFHVITLIVKIHFAIFIAEARPVSYNPNKNSNPKPQTLTLKLKTSLERNDDVQKSGIFAEKSGFFVEDTRPAFAAGSFPALNDSML
jgi:hypothetical protein